MKIRITLKDPDGVYESLKDATEESARGNTFFDKAETDAFLEERRERIGALCSKWVEYGEYVTIEIDTDAGTARVLTVDESNKRGGA